LSFSKFDLIYQIKQKKFQNAKSYTKKLLLVFDNCKTEIESNGYFFSNCEKQDRILAVRLRLKK